MREALAELLRELGLPPAAEITPFARSRRYANWRVLLEGGEARLLRIAVAPPGHRGLQHEAAARAALVSLEIPRVEQYALVPAEVFGAPASLSSWIEGQSGVGVLDVHPDTFADLCALCGQVARVVEVETAGRYGLSVVDGRFAPVRPSWAEEYAAQLHEWWGRAEAAGASLGPVGAALVARVEALAPALAEAGSFSLVHGDLSASNLILRVGERPSKEAPPPVEVVGVVDWELACMGDPLLGLAAALDLPDDALAHYVDGYGVEAVRAALDGSGAERVEAYAAGRVLQYLAWVVSAQIEGGGPMWGYGMAYAARLAQERLEPGFARRRLEAALAHEELPAQVQVPSYAEPARAALRRAVGRLSCRPVLGASALGPWMGAVAAALRDGERPAEGWVNDAHAYLDGLGPELEVRAFEPLGPRELWMGWMDRRVRALAGEDGLLLGLWWLAVEALVEVSGAAHPDGWSVPDAAFRGLQGFVEAAAVTARVPEGPTGILLHALVGSAASVRLAALAGQRHDPVAHAGRMSRIIEAWEDLLLFDGLEPEALAAVVGPGGRLVGAGGIEGAVGAVEGAVGAVDPAGWLVPVVLLAAERVDGLGPGGEGGLPVPRDGLVGAICRGLVGKT